MPESTPDRWSAYDDREVTTYTVELPRDDWQNWKQSVPRDVALYERLHQLVVEDTAPEHLPDDPPVDTTSVRVPRDAYEAWLETIPRSDSAGPHLRALIEQDTRAAEARDDLEVTPKTVSTFASRIRIRAMHAVDALRDDPDEEAAIEYLEKIAELANTLES